MNRIQKQISRLVAVLAAKRGSKIVIVEVPDFRNSPGMADTINRAAGRKICHFSLLLGCIVADEPAENIKRALHDKWFASSTNVVNLGV